MKGVMEVSGNKKGNDMTPIELVAIIKMLLVFFIAVIFAIIAIIVMLLQYALKSNDKDGLFQKFKIKYHDFELIIKDHLEKKNNKHNKTIGSKKSKCSTFPNRAERRRK